MAELVVGFFKTCKFSGKEQERVRKWKVEVKKEGFFEVGLPCLVGRKRAVADWERRRKMKKKPWELWFIFFSVLKKKKSERGRDCVYVAFFKSHGDTQTRQLWA